VLLAVINFECVIVYGQRMQVNAKNQRDWADQQIREKKAEKQREKDEEMGYAH